MFVAGAVAASAQSAFPQHKYTVVGANITAGANMAAVGDADGQAVFEIAKRDIVPFTQQCVNQGKPAPVTNAGNTPYYNVRMALPVPSCYTPTEQGEKVGLDWGVYTHLHSAGMEVLPNGDILAVYFSTPTGKAEADTCTTFVQCRRRYGCDEWDMPELLFTTYGGNDQSALLLTDKDTLWFFGGGRGMTDYVPFRIMKSTDNGATWTFSVPQMDKKLEQYTAQPVSNAFKNKKGELFVVLDGKGAQSFLLSSQDGGVTWQTWEDAQTAVIPLLLCWTIMARCFPQEARITALMVGIRRTSLTIGGLHGQKAHHHLSLRQARHNALASSVYSQEHSVLWVTPICTRRKSLRRKGGRTAMSASLHIT